MKRQLLLMTLVTSVLLLTGCSGITKEKLLKEMETAAEGKNISSISMDFDITMDIGAEGITLDMPIDIGMNLKMNTDEKKAYIDMDMNMNVLGESISETMQMYVLPENNLLVNYLHTDSSDIWEKQDFGIKIEDFEETLSKESNSGSILSGIDINSITLTEGVQTLDDKNVYILTYTLTGEELQKSYEESGNASIIEDAIQENGLQDIEGMEKLASLFDFDFTSLNLPVSVYIDSESYLPVQMDIDIENLDTFIGPFMDSIMAIAGEEMDMNITVDTFHIALTDIDYNTVDIPSLPDGAKEAAEAASVQLDTNAYIITDSENSALITVPEDWTVIESSENRVVITNADASQEVWYTMYSNMYGSSFYNHVEKTFAIPYLEEGTYMGHGHLNLDSGIEGAWVTRNDGLNLHFAWVSIGQSGNVFVEMVDYTGQDAKTAIPPMLEIIQNTGM